MISEFLNYCTSHITLEGNSTVLKLLCGHVNVRALRASQAWSVPEEEGFPGFGPVVLFVCIAGQSPGLVGSLDLELRRCCLFCHY